MKERSYLTMSNNPQKTGRPETFNAEYFAHSVHETDELKGDVNEI